MTKYMVILPLTLSMLFNTDISFADGYKYKSKDFTRQQKINQGLLPIPKYTTCRLKKRIRSKNGQQACIYQGGNKTYEMMIESFCPPKFKCIYNPGQKEPNIDDIINSLNNVGK
jgi:hypothetical protein|tara:strand:+ start:567 stop:908 length:342 start_codon:yes stop_codon:yes gene_type:complete